MRSSKMFCCYFILIAGCWECCAKPEVEEFAEVVGNCGAVSANLSMSDNSGFLQISLVEGIKPLAGQVYFFGSKEVSSFDRGEVFYELKKFSRMHKVPKIKSIYLDETPIYDGVRYWYNYGGSDLALLRLSHGDADKLNRERLAKIRIESLDKCYDFSSGYSEIGYIIITILYKDTDGVERIDGIVLNRNGQRKLDALR